MLQAICHRHWRHQFVNFKLTVVKWLLLPYKIIGSYYWVIPNDYFFYWFSSQWFQYWKIINKCVHFYPVKLRYCLGKVFHSSPKVNKSWCVIFLYEAFRFLIQCFITNIKLNFFWQVPTLMMYKHSKIPKQTLQNDKKLFKTRNYT